ncbi:S-layer homology domain-containing protein [Maledivibacter halophilus]|uniref:Outer membrane protein assembly factor BamB, contains PQQ-like beta-propeller repeat n=1 Tax=Maledivibacter halophilus TaxID=36842 RepID=A0A1T5J3B6_9FIRM|nr:S-layer homology domain-containing protein [Maledivibacter halophilus]SKC45910.1 Outer membrane protein assembly factor BamB, contains PQQ-like beta-propeller repeat [Maledivibacter halophilus]
MKLKRPRKIISILIILSMILSTITPVLGEDLIKEQDIEIKNETAIEEKEPIKEEKEPTEEDEEPTKEEKEPTEEEKEPTEEDEEPEKEDEEPPKEDEEPTKEEKEPTEEEKEPTEEDEEPVKEDEEPAKEDEEPTKEEKEPTEEDEEPAKEDEEPTKEDEEPTKEEKEPTEEDEESKASKIEITGETEVEAGKTIQLTAVVKNEKDEILEEEKVKWKSGDKEKAQVDEETGEVTGVGEGTVNIIAVSETNSDLEETISIEVKKEVKSLKLKVEILSPENGSSGAKAGNEIKIKFNKPVESLEGTNDSLLTIMNISEDGKNYADVHDYYEREDWYLLELEDDSNGESTIGVFKWEDGESIKSEKNRYYEIIIPKGLIKAVDSEEELEAIEWRFDTVEKEEELKVEILSPENGSSGAKAGNEIKIKFNKPVESLEGTNDSLLTIMNISEDGKNYADVHDYYEREDWYLLELEDDSNGESTIGVFKWEDGESIKSEKNRYYEIIIPKGLIKAVDSEEELEAIEWRFDTVEKPLEVESLSPENKASGVAKDAELSVTFNQEVEFKENSQLPVQVAVLYDKDGDGEVDQSNSLYGDITKHELVFSQDNPNKVTIQLKDEDGKNIDLEENHVYKVDIIREFIQSKTGEKILDKNIRWTFDTKPQKLEITSPINGKTISPKDEIFIKTSKELDEDYINKLNIFLYQIVEKTEENERSEELIKEGTGKDLAEIDDEDGKKIIIKLNNQLEIENSYKIKISTQEGEALEDLIIIKFDVKDVQEYALKEILDFSRRETVTTGMQNFISASMNNGIVYAIRDNTGLGEGKNDGKGIRIYAFDLYGNELWNKRIDGVGTSNKKYMPVYGKDGTVYIQTFTSDFDNSEFKTQLFAMDPYDGRVEWKEEFEGKGLIKTNPIIIDDEIIITTQEGIYSYEKNGDEKWSHEIDDENLEESISSYEIKEPPIKDENNNIYIAIDGKNQDIKDGKIQALDSNGNKKWSYPTKSGIRPPVIGSSGEVYIVDNRCVIKVLNPEDGSEIEDHPLNNYELSESNDYNITSLSIKNDIDMDTLYAVIGYYKEGKNKIISINSNGTENYIYENDEDSFGNSVVDYEGYLYYPEKTSSGGALYVIDPYGKEADSIILTGSSMLGFNSLYIDGNVLIGAKRYYSNVAAVKIQRRIPERPSSIEIIEKDKKLGENLEETLAVVVKNTHGKAMIGEEIQWESDNESIIEPTSDGKLHCKDITEEDKKVKLTVRVKGTDIKDIVEVEVVEKDPVPASIKILDEDKEEIKNTIDIEYGIPYQFHVQVLDQYGDTMEEEEEEVIWHSIINYFPAIDNNGLLNPKAEGINALEVISSTDVRVRKEIKYNVFKSSSEYKTIYPKEAIISFPGTLALSTVDQYGNIIELEEIKWSSSNENVAKVDEKGKVTSLECGTTIIKGTSGDITHEREITVVPSFGYHWNLSSRRLSEYIAQGNNGALYYIDSNQELISINSQNKEENWRIEVGSVYHIETSKNNIIYCIVKDKNSKYRLLAVKDNGEIKWEYEIENHVGKVITNIEESDEGTIYFASSQENMGAYLYSINNETGEKNWEKNFDEEISSFTLDSQDNIICVLKDIKDTIINKINSQGETIEENIFEDLLFGQVNIEIDDNNALYGYFREEGQQEDKEGICKIQNGNIVWKYDDESITLSKERQILLSEERLYFILGSSKEDYTFYVLNKEGEEIWKKKLNGLVGASHYILPSRYFIIDNDKNISLPLVEYKKEGFSKISIRSRIYKMDSNGNIIQAISYDKNKYGEFESVFLGKDKKSLYVIGIYDSNNKHNLVKFTFENNQEIRVEEIKIIGDKESIIVDEFLDLKAEVYNQFGTLIYNEKVTWFSENPEIATVDNNGRVKGIEPGTVTIIAQSQTNPQVKGALTLTVVEEDKYNVPEDIINEKAQLTIDFYKRKGRPNGDWVAFALGAYGENINKKPYLSNGRSYIDSLWSSIEANDNLGDITEYVRVSLGILGAGYDPHNFAGKNLIEKIYSYGSLSQGNNAAIWALIALDAADSDIPQNKGYFTQEYLIDYLLNNRDGYGWSIEGGGSEIDVTAMAIYALAPYRNRSDVKGALGEAVEWLKQNQNEDGGFNTFGTANSSTESTAQVIMALTSLGIDPQGKDFTRGQGNPVSSMLDNQFHDGSFVHIKTGSATGNGMATEQALQALAALKDFYENGISTIFYRIRYSKDSGDAIVRIEGKNRTILSQTRVDIILEETTLYEAVTKALDKGNVNYHGSGGNIVIENEEGWKWIELKNNKIQTKSSGDILYGGEEIILVDEGITNPVYTIINIPTKDLSIEKEFPVYVYDLKNRPVSGAEIIYYKEKENPVSTGIYTDKDGKGLITISNEGKFFITAHGKNLIRAKAEEVILQKNKEIEINIRVEGPEYTILPKTKVKIMSGDYPIEALKAAGLKVTYDSGKTDTEPPKTIDGVKGEPKWDIYPEKFGFDIPLEEGNDIVFTGNGTCYDHGNVFVPDKAVIDEEFTVIAKDSNGDPIEDEEIVYYKKGKHKNPQYTGEYTDEDGRAKLSIDRLGTYYITIIPDSDKHLVTPEAQEIEIKELIPIEEGVTVSITITGSREKEILDDYEVTTDIFDLQPYLRPGTGPTAEPSHDWYAEKFDEPTVAHAMVKALEEEDIDYDFQDYGWGLYFAMIDGDREKEYKDTSGWMYKINGVQGPGTQDQYIEDGDEIEFWFAVGGWQDPYLEIGENILLDILEDENATEEEILEALEGVVDEIQDIAGDVKSEKEAKQLINDIEDITELIQEAGERIETEDGLKEASHRTIDLIKALKKASEVVEDEKIKREIDEAAAAVIETIVMLINEQENEKEIDKIIEEMIKISGELKKEIGEGNSNNLERKIIEAVEMILNKGAVKEVEDKYIAKEGNKEVVTIDTNSIIKVSKNLMEKAKALKEKLQDNNIKGNREVQKKITIKIPKTKTSEIETRLPSGILNKVLKGGIDSIEIQTNAAGFKINSNTFKEEIKNKEIILNAKRIERDKLLNRAKNEIPEGSIIVDLNAKAGEQKISTFEKPIEISIPYKEKVKNKEKITVYLLRDDGTIETVGGLYNLLTREVKFNTSHFSKYFAKEENVEFNDLEKVKWAEDEIEIMASKGIIKGREDEKYDPNANITRAEFAVLMTRMLKYKAGKEEIPFEDVIKDKWYYKEVAAAHENGLMQGVSNNEFNPDGNITGQEVITVIERILIQRGYKKAKEEELKNYSQKDKTANWAKAAVAFGLREGIINENKEEGFVPNRNVTRAQVAAILYRLYNLIIK